MSTLAERFGAPLTARREALGKSRRGLADELGVADPTLLAYERGDANPTLAKVEALAEEYGLAVDVTVRAADAEDPLDALALDVDDLLIIAEALRAHGEASELEGTADAARAAELDELITARRVAARSDGTGLASATLRFSPGHTTD